MDKKSKNDASAVAIIGVGCIFPQSQGLKAYWRLLSRGEDAIIEVPETHWSAADYYREDPSGGDYTYCKRGGFLSPVSFDPTEYGMPPSVLEATDTSQLLGLMATKMALEDAGYGEGGREWNREATGVILGVTGTQELVIPLGSRLGFPYWKRALDKAGVTPEQHDYIMAEIADAYVAWQENSFPGLLGNVVAGRIANRFDLGGTNCVTDAACASSLSAINLAVLELISGRSDMMITGGVDAINDIFMHMCFAKTSVLSFTGDAKPFSKDADGTVLGEGLGLFIMKRLADAEKAGDRIYAVLKAVGASSDGRSAGIYAPVAAGQQRAVRRAYEYGNVPPETIELMEAHGTGTRVGDAEEFKGLAEFFSAAGSKKQGCALGSVKSMIGHTKAAAGAASLAKTVLALHHKAILPTLKVSEPDPKLNIEASPFHISTQLRPWLSRPTHPRRAAMSSFGFGGSNYHMVLEEYGSAKQETAWDGSVEILAFSGDTKATVQQKIDVFVKELAPETQTDDIFLSVRRAAGKTRKEFSATDAHRALIVVERNDDCAAVLKKAGEAIGAAELTPETPCVEDGSLFYGAAVEGHEPGKTAFLFPGQGSQYLYMGRDLAVAFPEAHNVFEAVNQQFAGFRDDDSQALTDYIFPPGYTDAEKKDRETELRSTDVAQPAIGAVSLGMANILKRFGLSPDMVGGHSFGELSALCCAGWIDEETFLSLASARGKYMAAAGAGKEKGSMLAVKGDLAAIEKLIADNNLNLVLANRNSYEQGVLSGREDEIDRAAKVCKENKFRCTKLPVAAAFHTELVQNAAKPFSDYLKKKGVTPTDVSVFSNVTADAYPADKSKAKNILGKQILSPVNFVDEVEAMYAQGARTFVEVGPKTVLTGLVKSILRDRKFQARAVDVSAGRKFGMVDLAKTLCFFAANGQSVSLTGWEEPVPEPTRKQKMSVPLCGANYRSPRTEPPRKRPVPPVQSTGPAVAPSAPQPITSSTTPTTPVADNATITATLSVVADSLRSIQTLQQQTAAAHQKFLETQNEAGRTLGMVMERTRHLSETILGQPMTGKPLSIPTPPPASPTVAVSQPPQPATPPAQPPIQPPAQPTAPPSAPALQAPPQASIDTAAIEKAMLDIVSRVTGYPVDMLDLNMDIGNDLGIDSIKRVEILSVFEEEHPDMPSADPEALAEMNTLGEICRHIIDLAGSATPAASTPAPAAPAPQISVDASAIESAMLDIVSRVTGYPVDMLDLNMDIGNDLGIDSIKRVEILSVFEEEHPDMPSADPEALAEMNTLGEICRHIIGLAGAAAPTPAAPQTGGAPQTFIDASAIESAMLDIVSRVTGYPVDMLDLNMDIGNDLGIDSIKRVEILSVFEEEHPDMPSADPEALAEMNTLGEICRHIIDLAGGAAAAGEEPSQAPPDELQSAASTEASILSYDQIIRRTVKLVEAPLKKGPIVSIPEGRTIYVVGNDAKMAGAIADELNSRDIKAVCLEELSADQDFSDAAGLVLVPAMRAAKKGLWNATDVTRVKDMFEAVVRAGRVFAKIKGQGKTSLLTAVIRLDGTLGFDTDKALSNPLPGAFAGLAKTADIEWEATVCHVIDIDPAWKQVTKAAAAVVDNMLDAAGPVEVGLTADARRVISLETTPYPEGEFNLNSEDVIVVSGGARGVTAQCALKLVRKTGAAIVLLGRSPLPDREPDWLEGVTVESEIKAKIRDNEFAGKKVTPVAIEASFKKHMANREIAANLSAFQATARAVAYYSVDIRDAAAVKKIFNTVRKSLGKISCILHGAGVLEDKFIVDKTRGQFDKVFDTKTAGAQALLAAATPEDLRHLVFFSSVTARMGNKGQVDYAMANEVLNKTAQKLARQWPDCRVVAVNWGPWDGGMVTASLKREFEKNNITLIPLDAGADCLMAELTGSAETGVEVIIGAGFADMTDDIMSRDVAVADEPALPSPATSAAAEKSASLFTAFDRDISVDAMPILSDHVLKGVPVVPFALAAEWVGNGAMHSNPGLILSGIDDMRLLAGIKAERDNKVSILAGRPKKNGAAFEVNVHITDAAEAGQGTLYYSARAILGNDLDAAPDYTIPAALTAAPAYTRKITDVYNDILFHGKNLQGIKAIAACCPEGLLATTAVAPAPDQWIVNPIRKRWLMDPLAVDVAFQLAIVWCYENAGQVSLPISFEQFRRYRDFFPSDGVQIALEVTGKTSHKMTGDFTFLDADNRVIARMTGYQAIMDKSLAASF